MVELNTIEVAWGWICVIGGIVYLTADLTMGFMNMDAYEENHFDIIGPISWFMGPARYRFNKWLDSLENRKR